MIHVSIQAFRILVSTGKVLYIYKIYYIVLLLAHPVGECHGGHGNLSVVFVA
jgi:hypothetical protein